MKKLYTVLSIFLSFSINTFAQDSFSQLSCVGGTGNQARLYLPITADFDGDNDKDIITIDEGGAYRLYKNEGSGNFTSQQILSGLAWSILESKDLDSDNDIDLVSTAGKIYLNNGSGTFTQLSGTFWTATGTINVVRIADFNGDNKQDILWFNSNSGTGYKNQLWINSGTTGNPNFALLNEFENEGLPNGGSVVGDIDNDSDLDLILCSAGGWSGKVWKNNGSGVLTVSQTLSTYTGNGFLVDWDKDGDNDFMAFDTYNNWGLRLWTNNGTGTFSAPSSASMTDVTVGFVRQLIDLNGDTYLDIVCSSYAGARYYINSGCTLVLNNQVLGNSNNGTVVDDFNNDGKKDIFCAARDAQSCIYLNSLTTQSYVALPSLPSVSTPINYAQNATATALTATGTNLKWYTTETDGTGSSTAPTPITTTVGTVSYWVSQTNANGCESGRAKMDVVVSGSCLGGTGNQARLYNPLSADFDGDNDKDIIVMDEGGNYWLNKNDGTGKFSSTQILNGLGWSTLEFKDLDNDNDIDLVSTAGKVYLNNGSGSFTQLVGTFWTATGAINLVRIADFNKDGKQDILWLNSNMSAGYNNQVWLNNGTTGNPNFTLGSEFDNTGLGNNNGSAVGDIDNDNDMDLIVCSTGGWGGKVYKNNGSGVFISSQALATYTGNGYIVDWDKDGDNDFLAFDTYNNWGLRLWTNDGTGNFSTPSASSMTDVSVGFVRQIVDINGDNYLDIVCSNAAGARFYLNTGCGLTLNSQVLNTANNNTVVDDFNNDGKKDIFCAARDAQSCLNLLNIAPTASAVTPPSVTTPVTYCQNATASALTATGTSLKWYTTATGGTGSATAPTPSTATAGTTSYWVSSSNANGCESERGKIDVTINALPSTPSVTTPVTYCQNATATVLTATGSNLKWYTAAMGGTGSTTTPTPSTTTVGTTAYWVSQTVNGCESDRAKIDVTINPRPSAPTASNQSFCISATVANLTATGTNIKWYATATGGSVLLSTTNLTTGTTYYASQTNANGCESDRTAVVVTINATMSTPSVSTPVLYCQNTTATALTASGSNLKWFTVAIGGTGSTTAPTPSTTTVGTTSYWVSQSLNGCESDRAKIDVTVNALPAAPSVSTPVIYCQNTTATALTATGTNLKWYTAATGGTVSTTAPTPSTTTAGTISYWVSQTVNGCESDRSKIDVTINALPTSPTVTTPVTYCQNATATVLTATGTNLKWYTAATGGTGSTTAPTPSTTTAGTTSYWVSQTVSGCESDRAKIDITVNATPIAPSVISPINYAQGATATALTATGSNLKWYTAATGGTGSTTALTPSTINLGTISYWVSQTVNGCESDRSKIDVNVSSTVGGTHLNFDNSYVNIGNLIPTGSSYTKEAWIKTSNITGSNILSSGTSAFWFWQNNLQCGHGGGFIDVYTPASSMLNTWTHVAVTYDKPSNTMKLYVNGILQGQNTNVANYTSGNIQIGAFNNGARYTGDMDEVRIWSKALSADDILRRKDCELQGNEAGLIAYYKFNQGFDASTNTAVTTLTDATSNGNTGTLNGFNLTGSTSNWLSGSVVTTGSSIPAAPTTTSTAISYCQNATASALSANGTSLKWYTVATGGTSSTTAPTPSTSTAGTTSYWVSSSNANGCESERVQIDVTVKALPSTPSVSTPVLYCQNATATALTASGSNLKWFTVAIGGTGSTTAPTPSTTTVGTTAYWVSQTNGNGCESDRAKIDVTINPQPSAPTASNQSFCVSATVANLTATGTDIKWYVAATGGTALVSTTALTTGTTYYASQTNANGCESSRTAVVVTINATMSTPSVSTPVLYCQNATATDLTASGSNLKWFTVATGGTGSTTAPTPSTTTVGTTSYWVSQSLNGCESERVKIDVTINALPSAPSVSTPATYCQNATANTLTATGSNLKWYSSATGGTGSAVFPTPSTATAGITSYWVSQTNGNGCESNRSKIDVMVNAPPAVPTVTTPVTYCQNTAANALSATGTNIKWYTSATGGTANATAPTPSTTTVGSTSYWVASANTNGCESERVKIDVVVNATPVAPSVSTPVKYCQNATSSALTATGTNIKWYTTATGGTGNANAPTPNTSTAGTISYWVMSTNANGCESQRVKIDVIINALPSTPSVSTPVTYCQNVSANALTATGNNIKWYTSATGGTSSATAPTPNTTTVGSTSYWVLNTDVNGCESERVKIDVTINEAPAPPIVTTPIKYCQNVSYTALTATGTNVKWYTSATGSNGSTTAPMPNTTVVGTTSYWVNQTNDKGCQSEMVKMDLIVNATPATPTVQTPLNYCQNATASPLSVAGNLVVWYTSATGSIGSTTTPTINTAIVSSNSYWVKVIDINGCESDRARIDVNIETFKNTLAKQVTLCKDQYFVFNLKNDKYPNLVHTWTSSNGYTSAKETDTLRASGSYFVETTTLQGCKSKDTISLKVDTTTIESNFAVATQLVTIDVVKVVNISKTDNDSSRWIIPNGLKVIGNVPALLEFTASDTGSYRLGLITYKGGCSTVSYQDVTLYPKTHNQESNDSLYFVKTFKAFPNPAGKGENLNVLVELSKESAVRLRLIDLSTNRVVSDKSLSKADRYEVDFGNGLKQGSYVIFLESPYGRNVIKVIVM